MRYFLSLIILTGLISCKKPVHHNEITKIELSRSGAWSDQGTVVIVDSTLTYRYYGLLNGSDLRQKRKYYEGKVSEGFWDTLNDKFKQINYKKIDPDIKGPSIVDVPIFELIIHSGKNIKHIIRADTGVTDQTDKVLSYLNNSYKKIKLYPVEIPFKFETIFQNLPQPNLNQVRFPPPLKSR